MVQKTMQSRCSLQLRMLREGLERTATKAQTKRSSICQFDNESKNRTLEKHSALRLQILTEKINEAENNYLKPKVISKNAIRDKKYYENKLKDIEANDKNNLIPYLYQNVRNGKEDTKHNLYVIKTIKKK